MIDRLESWRRGKAGTILFYSYLVAILVAFTLAVVGAVALYRQGHELRATVKLLDENSTRSCKAIHGALALWREERALAQRTVMDPEASATARSVAAARASALTVVLRAGGGIDCEE